MFLFTLCTIFFINFAHIYLPCSCKLSARAKHTPFFSIVKNLSVSSSPGQLRTNSYFHSGYIKAWSSSGAPLQFYTACPTSLLMAKPNAIVKALFSCLSHIQFAPFSNWEIISIFDSVFMLLLLSSSIFLLSICNCNHLHIYAYVCIFCKYL